MHKVINGCRTIKMREVGYVVKYDGYFELVLESLTKKKDTTAAFVILFGIISGDFLFYIDTVIACCVNSIE